MRGLNPSYRVGIRVLSLALLILSCCRGICQQVPREFDFTPRCADAYRYIISFRFEEGRRLLQQEKRSSPQNLIPYFLENYIDFFTLFFNEDPVGLKRYETDWKRRLGLLAQGPAESPYSLYTAGLMHFQRAVLEAKSGNYWTAGLEFRKAFLLIRDNERRHPDFPLNGIYAGALQAAAGTIPDSYRWFSNLLGISGTIDGGLKKIRHFLERQDVVSRIFYDEALFFYCYVKFYIQNDRAGVSRIIRDPSWDVRNNHLLAFVAANISLNNQDSERTLEVITQRNASPAYFQTSFWDFELGNAKMHRLDPDAAYFLERFVTAFKGNYYLKDALQKLSWFYFLNGELPKARFYRAQVLIKGKAFSDADQQALKEAQQGEWPDPVLLKARLLNDGGYLAKALRLLEGRKANDFTREKDRLEFNYRLARLYDDSGRPEEALDYYLRAVYMGEKSRAHFAARSALQMGVIYESRGDLPTAAYWYRRCISMKEHDFKNSLDQRAKAGLLRCRVR